MHDVIDEIARDIRKAHKENKKDTLVSNDVNLGLTFGENILGEIQNALVDKDKSSLSGEEPHTETDEDVNAPKLKNIIVKALKQEPSLPLDIQTLSFEAGMHNVI